MNLQQLLRDPSLDARKVSDIINATYFKERQEQREIIDWVEVIDRMKLIGLKPNDEPTRFVIEEVYEDDILYYDVSCVVDDKDKYAVDLTPWRESLSYDIHQLIIEFVLTGKMSREEMVAHVIAEMTFYGFEEQNIDAMIERLRGPHETFEVVSIDELFDSLDEGELEDHEKYVPISKRETKEEQ